MMRLSVEPIRLRALLVAGVGVTALGVGPAAAHAATVSAAAGQVSYVGADSESNRVTIVPWGLSLRVTETGTKAGGKKLKLGVGTGCWKIAATSAACSNGSSGVSFVGGDGHDFLDASRLTSPLTASGGPGNDTLLARNGAADTLTCGGGNDGGSGDLDDSIAADCEALELPAATVDPGPVDPVDPVDPGDPVDPVDPADPVDPLDPVDPNDPVDPSDPVDPGDPADPTNLGPGNTVPPSIPAQTVGVSASGVATVLIACPADSGGCSGTVSIELPPAIKKPGRAKIAPSARTKSPLRLGRKRFKARAGTTKAVRVRLSKRGRRRILRGRRHRVRIVVRTRSAAGKSSIVSQDVTLRLRPRASGGKARRR